MFPETQGASAACAPASSAVPTLAKKNELVRGTTKQYGVVLNGCTQLFCSPVMTNW
jgi:hypothetical protein